MNKIALGIVTLGSLVLAGCSDGPNEPVVPQKTITTVVYSPATSEIPLPNDVLFSGTQDFTLNIPVADPTDFTDPQNAISALDGWSTVAPFAINFKNSDSAITLNAATVVPGQTVRIFEVLANTTFDPANPTNLPNFVPTQVIRELAPLADFVAVAQGTSVAIIPTRPLAPRASYIVVATNGITDSNDVPVETSPQYSIVSSQDVLEGPFAGLVGLQGLVNQYETLVSTATNGPSRDSIVVSFQFTTQSVGASISTAKAAYIDFPLSQGARPAADLDLIANPLDPSGFLTTEAINPALGAANIARGELTINYMLEAPQAQDDPLTVDVDESSDARVLTGFWKGAANIPGVGANPFAGGTMTYINSLPEINGQERIPVLATIPLQANCPKPATGYPVVIFQHGINGNRTALFGIGDTFAAACMATIAIDLPLHGLAPNSIGLLFAGFDAGDVRERTFGVDLQDNTTRAPGPDGEPDSSGAHFINLQSLLTARDNTSQAVYDLLTLERAIPGIDLDDDPNTVDFDANNISFMGHSLGGIVGSSYTAFADGIQVSILANPGGGIVNLLDGSDTFGGVIRGGVAAGLGVAVDSAEFAAQYPQFLFAAQTVVDSPDPVNTAAFAIGNNIPTLMMRNEADTVVPNNVATAPLSGTDPLAAVLGLATVTPDENNSNISLGGRQISRINTGTHGSVITPAGPNGATEFLAVTAEMQAEIVSFILSGGTQVQVGDPTLLD